MKILPKLSVFATVLIAGCTELNEDVAQENLCLMTFSASVSEEADTKATIDALDIKWSAGDEIGIYDGTAFRKFTLKSGAGTTSAVFEGEAAPAMSYTAVYPYDEKITVDSEGKIYGLSVPRFQTAGDCPVIMTAKCGDGGSNFEFKNALAYVKFTPEFDCHKVVFETYGKTNYHGYPRDLCGDIVLARDDDYNRYWSDNRDIMLARVTANATNHVILSGEIKAGVPCCIAVAPKVLDMGFKFIFDSSDDNLQYSKKLYRQPDSGILRGHVLNFGTFSKEGTAWTESEAVLAFCDSGENEQPSSNRAIYDWRDFKRIEAYCRKSVASQSITLQIVEDIDFNGGVLQPAVFDIEDGRIFIYGNGHKIANYVQGTVNVNDDGCAGMFVAADLCRLYFDGLNIYPKEFKVTGESDYYAGAFVAKAHCTEYLSINKCHVYGDIDVNCGGNAYVGGFCGMFELPGVEHFPRYMKLFSDCLMQGSVSARSANDDACAGGFIALVNAPENDYKCGVENCRNRAAVLAEGYDNSYAGGIIGCDRDILNGGDVALHLEFCVNDGPVTANALDEDDCYAGGMIGCHDSDGISEWDSSEKFSPSVSNCLNRGTITSNGGKGLFNTGLVGGMTGYCYDEDTSFSYCIDDGELSSDGKCAHISGSSGSYGAACYWTKGENHFGICNKEDKDGYKPGVKVEELKDAGFDGKWIVRDGRLDLNIIN